MPSLWFQHLIIIQTDWLLPESELKCRMGFRWTVLDDKCTLEPLIQADWTVWDDGQIVASGSDGGRSSAFGASAKHLERYLGSFKGKAKHKYVVEVRFEKDGTSLNAANPHLVVKIVKRTD